MAGLEPATEGVTCEVTLCYGTCYTILYNSRRAHGLRERNPLFNQQGDNQNGTNWRVLFTPHLYRRQDFTCTAPPQRSNPFLRHLFYSYFSSRHIPAEKALLQFNLMYCRERISGVVQRMKDIKYFIAPSCYQAHIISLHV